MISPVDVIFVVILDGDGNVVRDVLSCSRGIVKLHVAVAVNVDDHDHDSMADLA